MPDPESPSSTRCMFVKVAFVTAVLSLVVAISLTAVPAEAQDAGVEQGLETEVSEEEYEEMSWSDRVKNFGFRDVLTSPRYPMGMIHDYYLGLAMDFIDGIDVSEDLSEEEEDDELNQALLYGHAKDLAEARYRTFDDAENTFEETRNYAWSKAKAELIEHLNDGTTEEYAKQQAKQVIDDYYAGIEKNLNLETRSFVNSLQHLNEMAQEFPVNADYDTDEYMDIHEDTVEIDVLDQYVEYPVLDHIADPDTDGDITIYHEGKELAVDAYSYDKENGSIRWIDYYAGELQIVPTTVAETVEDEEITAEENETVDLNNSDLVENTVVVEDEDENTVDEANYTVDLGSGSIEVTDSELYGQTLFVSYEHEEDGFERTYTMSVLDRDADHEVVVFGEGGNQIPDYLYSVDGDEITFSEDADEELELNETVTVIADLMLETGDTADIEVEEVVVEYEYIPFEHFWEAEYTVYGDLATTDTTDNIYPHYFEEREIELVNGTKIEVLDLDEGYISERPYSHGDIYMERVVYSDEDIVSGEDFSESEWRVYHPEEGYQAFYEPKKAYETFQALHETHQMMRDNVDEYVEEVYQEYDQGDLDVEDLIDVETLVTEYLTELNQTGYYGYAGAQLALLGVNSSLNDLFTIELLESNETYTGMFFTDHVPEETNGTYVTGYNYSIDNFTSTVWLVGDFGTVQVEEDFRILEILDYQDNPIENVSLHEYNRHTHNVSNLEEEMEDLREVVQELQEPEDDASAPTYPEDPWHESVIEWFGQTRYGVPYWAIAVAIIAGISILGRYAEAKGKS